MGLLKIFLAIIAVNIVIRIIHLKAPDILPEAIRNKMDRIYGKEPE